MSLFSKRIGRRVAGVGIGATLLALGLQAPAYAAAPVISSFTPTSGPAAGGCVIVVTGTALDDFALAPADVDFDSAGAAIPTAPAADVLAISDTELWVSSPALSAGSAYTITITNPGGTSTSTGTFLATAGAGGCAPTVDSFVPTCGSTNDTVVITGTNLLMDAAGGPGTIQGGIVSFSPFTDDATHSVPDVDEATSLSVLVSTDAADGPIKVTTKGTTAAPVSGLFAFSDTDFNVPPPDCTVGGPTHGRAITLSLKKHLVAKGMVSLTDATDTTTDCIAGVPVKIQKRKSGHWKTVGSTTTKDNGAYKKRIKDKPGRYRAKAPKVTLTTGDVCSGAKSRTVKHR
jgi:hypothetical protein